MDHARARQAHALEREGITTRRQADAQTDPGPRPSTTVVVAHRHTWLRDRLAGLLSEAGMHVVCASDRATDVVAAIVAEQPDVVFMTEHLRGARGPELLARAQALCPTALFAMQVDADDDVRHVPRTGVAAIYSRGMRPPEIVADLGRLLPTDPPDVTAPPRRARVRASHGFVRDGAGATPS